MRIAFDVKGTIEGPDQNKVLRLYKALEKQGHEMIVWSSVYSFATGAVARHALSATPQSKTDKWSEFTQDSDYMDLAVDDEPQTWLATKRLVLVRDLPDDVEGFARTLTEEHDALVAGAKSGGPSA